MKKIKSDILELPNMGQVTARKLALIGITTKQQFLDSDPYALFAQLLEKVDPTLCRCALGGIIGAHEGKKWNEVRARAAEEFIKRFPKQADAFGFSKKKW
ncbi:MAG: hypothetical protein UU47_C0019G0012 [candidate division TM6 bacterium GW2011_GWE2_41_16]|nr:MAG: hypothetical protein UU47_C0019G0012 [candidate division TM6 bacterium GW2011_GWE2_41_16]